MGSLFSDPEEIRRINPFDWDKAFPAVFGQGGFDIVIGNPPYSYRNATEGSLRSYYASAFECAEGNYDLYKFFLERSVYLSKSPGGRVGMILSATFLVQPTFKKLRNFILDHNTLHSLAPLGPGAFRRATVDTVILVLERTQADKNHEVRIIAPPNPTLLAKTSYYPVPQKRFMSNSNYALDYKLDAAAASLVSRLFESFPQIETGFEFGVGINTGFIRDELVSDTKKDYRYHPMIPGSGISRYGPVRPEGWILYDSEFIKSRGSLGRSLPAQRFFDEAKILLVRTRNLSLQRRIIATLDRSRAYNLNRLSNIIAKSGRSLPGLLGILNSSLFDWLFRTRFFDYEIKPIYLRSCPLANSEDPHLIVLVERMLKLQRQLTAAKTTHDQAMLERQVEATDWEINRLVYELYELTPEEIAVIQKSTEGRHW